MMKCLWYYCLLSCSAGSAGVMESLGTLLKISVTCPLLFPHVMPSVLFNKHRAKKALCYGQSDIRQAQTKITDKPETIAGRHRGKK